MGRRLERKEGGWGNKGGRRKEKKKGGEKEGGRKGRVGGG